MDPTPPEPIRSADAPATPSPRGGHWIVFIGLRASGKSTVARAFARLRRSPSFDLDRLVCERFGDRSVTEIWEQEGEAAFRAAEASVLADTVEGPSAGVLALGGGTPMIDAARTTLERAQASGRARVVYLAARPPFLAARLRRRRGDRPDLVSGTIEEEVAWAYGTRDGPYRDLADLVVDVEPYGDHPPSSTAAAIDRALRALDAPDEGGPETGPMPSPSSPPPADAPEAPPI